MSAAVPSVDGHVFRRVELTRPSIPPTTLRCSGKSPISPRTTNAPQTVDAGMAIQYDNDGWLYKL
jgi:hypothetical protein